MPRPEKVQAVADIKERLESARAVFLAEYAGLSVKQQQMLRRGLKEHGAEFKVVKMTLARRAAAELEIDDLDELLLGPTGLAFAQEDPVAAAKALQDFSRDHEVFAIKGGLLGSEFLTPERVSELASIEPRDVLLAKLAGLFAAPMANVAALLGALQQEMAGLLEALLSVKEPEADAAAATDADATVAPEPEPDAHAAEAPDADTADAPDAEAGADPEPDADAAAAAPDPQTDETADPEASDEAPDAATRDQAEEAEEETDGEADD